MRSAQNDIELLYSDSVHARYGAVQALRERGSSVTPELIGIILGDSDLCARMGAVNVLERVSTSSDEKVECIGSLSWR